MDELLINAAWQAACECYRMNFGVEAPAVAREVAFERFEAVARRALAVPACTPELFASEAPGAAYLELLWSVRDAVKVGAVEVQP